MLKNIRVKNFYSIGERQELSLNISSKDILNGSGKKIKDSNINLVSCVIGHNASGKTTILKAISFLFWFIANSYTSLKSEKRIPINQHELKQNKPTEIEIEFFNKDNLYKYLIVLNKKEILKEVLIKKNSHKPIFELNRDANRVEIKPNNLKINSTDEVRFKERGNVSLLSSLIDTGYLSEIIFFKNFETNVHNLGMTFFNLFSDSEKLHKDQILCQEILKCSKDIDLGISDFLFKESQMRNKENQEEVKSTQVLQCVHTTQKGNFILPIFEESNGTQQSYSILFQILPILKNGGLVVLDEIDSGLHPYVTKKIISLFERESTNPHNAQLIFSTHQHLLLNDRTKTQIFITEKNDNLSETEIYRLDDIEGIRNDENYFHKYIAGAYGGTPKIDWL